MGILLSCFGCKRKRKSKGTDCDRPSDPLLKFDELNENRQYGSRRESPTRCRRRGRANPRRGSEVTDEYDSYVQRPAQSYQRMAEERPSNTGNRPGRSMQMEQFPAGGLCSIIANNRGVSATRMAIGGNATFYIETKNSSRYSLDRIFSDMKSTLKSHRRRDLMPHLPWMQAFISHLKPISPLGREDEEQPWNLRLSKQYVNIAMCPIGPFGDLGAEKDIELQNIFDEMQSRSVRILIEAPPGYGKTTLVEKLCYDWAVGIGECTTRFQLVILILLRNFKLDSFGDGFIDAAHIGKSGVDNKVIQEVIEKNASNTLVVLDGFDELPFAKQQLLYPLLQGDVLSEATVIVTSRPGFDEYHKTNTTQRCDSMTASYTKLDHSTYFYSLFQKRIVIKGIPQTQQKEFLCKHLCHAFNDSQLDKLNIMLSKNYDRKLFECPLFLLLVAVLCIETNIMEAPKTRTDLYKHLFNFIVKRGLSSLEDYQGTVNLFEYDEDNVPFYVSLLTRFGELALHSVKERKMIFTEQEIVRYFSNGDKRILKLGFMTYKDKLLGVKQITWYEAVHGSLLEFAAAYYLYNLWKSGKTEEFKSKLTSLELFLPDCSLSADVLVFTFLSGLMKKDPQLLFEFFQQFKGKYSNWWDAYYQPVLSEIEESDTLLTALSPFVTSEWHINTHGNYSFYNSSLHRNVVERAVKNGDIKSIIWDACSPANLPSKIKVSNIVLQVSSMSDFLCRLQCQIECGNLYCQLLGDKHTRMRVTYWKQMIALVQTLHFKRISFDFASSCSLEFLPIVLEETKTGFLKNKKFQRIKCELKNEKGQILKLLLDLIEFANVEEVQIVLQCSTTRLRQCNPADIFLPRTRLTHIDSEFTDELWDYFIQRIGKMDHIKVFTLKNCDPNRSVRIDEVNLCDGERKQWRAVSVEGYITLMVKNKNSRFYETVRAEAAGTVFVKAFWS